MFYEFEPRRRRRKRGDKLGLQVFDEHAMVAKLLNFAPADVVGPKDLLGAQTTPIRVDSIIAYTDDTVAVVVKVILWDGVGSRTILQVTVPALSGTAGVAAIDVLTLLPATAPALLLPIGWTIGIELGAALSSGKVANLYLLGGAL